MTMNLIQLQQALQTMPMQNIMQYANGDDPNVPAYMALSELNRRQMLQQEQTAAQKVPQRSEEHTSELQSH